MSGIDEGCSSLLQGIHSYGPRRGKVSMTERRLGVLKQGLFAGFVLLHWVDDEGVFIQSGTSFRSAAGFESLETLLRALVSGAVDVGCAPWARRESSLVQKAVIYI